MKLLCRYSETKSRKKKLKKKPKPTANIKYQTFTKICFYILPLVVTIYMHLSYNSPYLNASLKFSEERGNMCRLEDHMVKFQNIQYGMNKYSNENNRISYRSISFFRLYIVKKTIEYCRYL